ncbi:FecCD family ABC transporter permease [Ferrovibrio sp.]|uniref:FecCD family ABC transporter permease n=1 Tax=Ferrovibrio sp. TaxID=1917215 RepID=UPI0035158731
MNSYGLAVTSRWRPPGFALQIGGGLGLLALLALAALAIGAVPLSVGEVLSVLTGQAAEPRHEAIVLHLRLPRLLMAALVGAALAMSGAIMQGLFRNPLADPFLIGVSAGSSFAAALVIVFGGLLVSAAFMPVLLPVGAFAGGLLVILLVYRLALVDGQTVVPMLLLAGIAFNAIAMSGTGFMVFVADDNQLRDISFWTLGSVGGAQWGNVLPLIPFVATPLLAMRWFAGALDALNLGECEAQHLGYRVEHVKRLACLCTALAVGGAVSVSGTIGFVGLLVPHLVRLLTGPQHHRVLPLSAIAGACLLIAADLGARTVVAPAELPIGLITSLIGAPFFISLLLRHRRGFVG